MSNQPKNKIIQNNIMIMLQYLLPTYPISKQLFSSYDIITASPNEKKTTFIQNNVPQIITIQEKSYHIKKIIWINDLINQPKYVEFADKFNQFTNWKNTTKNEIVHQIDNIFINKDIYKIIEQQINLIYKIDFLLNPKSKYNATYNYQTHKEELNDIIDDYKNNITNNKEPTTVTLPSNIDKDTLFQMMESLFFMMRVKHATIKGFTPIDQTNYETNKTNINNYYILTTILNKYFSHLVNFSSEMDEPDIKKYMKDYFGQYIDFKNLLGEFIKPNFESTNYFLQTEINHFINGIPNELEKYMQMVKQLRNNTRREIIDDKLKKILYVGASVQSSNKKSEFQNILNESPKYEIYVSIDVAPIKKIKNKYDITLTQNVINMKDKISSQVNKLNAKCNNQNNNLVQIFQSLREGKSATKFYIKNNRKMLKDSAKKNGGNTTRRRKYLSRNNTTKLRS
jgi:hypothetical protein